MIRAIEQLFTTGDRWLQMTDRLCQLPIQKGTFPTLADLVIDPIQQLSHQLGGILPSQRRGAASDPMPSELPSPAIVPAPRLELSRSVQPTPDNPFAERVQARHPGQMGTSIARVPSGQRSRLVAPPLTNRLGAIVPMPGVDSPRQSAYDFPYPPDPRLFEKVGDLNPVQLPSVQHILRVMAALSLNASPNRTKTSNQEFAPLEQIPPPAPPSALPPRLTERSRRSLPSFHPPSPILHPPSPQPTEPSSQISRYPSSLDSIESGLQLAQSASALERVLWAHVAELGKGETGKGKGETGKGEGCSPGLEKLNPESAEVSGEALGLDQALLVEEILDELSDRLELDFIRTYGTSGGS
ncbi:hypothetical protein K9N68_03695 [Kovacikia minuta CCNUW1]|uniref:hypothetical protein n=1 Tax=Kovacikia minuta TaxID=2931930 RepID=UPI001CCDF2F9|nr:hypothetical protein [Kovacikia minuta]UBF27086.1 hypothetical protein K9N68_03695 [Kovacikia minuta CCNUW1]